MGRDHELTVVGELLHDRDCRGVLITGAAGVGKTALMRKAASRFRQEGLHVDWVATSRSTRDIPLGALAPSLPAEIPEHTDRLQLLLWGRDAFSRDASGGVESVFVDDVNLLDGMSATVLYQLVSEEAAFLVGTIRDGQAVPEPLSRLLDAGLMRQVELPPLSRDQVDTLLESVLAGHVDGRTRHRFWELSRGNPLFLRELVLGSIDREVLRFIHGVWRHDGTLLNFTPMPDALKARLANLSEDEREVLQIVSVAEPASIGLLLALGKGEVLEMLEQRKFVELHEDGRRLTVHSSHPFYAEMVRDSISKMRARRISGFLADQLAQFGSRRREDLLHLATWSLESGQPSNPQMMVQAASKAITNFEYDLAERLAAAAQAQGDHFEATLTLATAIAPQGRLEEAEKLLADLVANASTDLERTRAVLTWSEILVFHRGDPSAIELLRETASAVTDPACRDELEAMIVFATSYLGDLPRTIEDGRQFLSEADRTPTAQVRVAVVYTYARGLMADFNGLESEIEEALYLAEQHPEAFPVARDLLLVNQTGAMKSAGYLIKAQEAIAAEYERVIATDAPELLGLWATQYGHVLAMRGRAENAMRYFDEAIAALRVRDPVGMLPLALSFASYAAALIEDRVRVKNWLDLYCERAKGWESASGTAWEARARAWMRYADGDVSGAAEAVTEGADKALRANIRSFAALMYHDAVRLGYTDIAADELAHLERSTSGRLIPALLSHARALRDKDPARLEQVAQRFAGVGAELYAAEAAAQASFVHRREGDHREYRRTRSRALRWASHCPGVRTPWLWVGRPEDLTAREFEVATMAARGLTNRQIGNRLFVSPRTVGNHLASVYAKLGAKGRRDLPQLLELDGFFTAPGKEQ